jgi:hypothetical protein
MAISRRPKPTLVAATPAVDVDALINKGGSIARSVAEPAAISKPAPVVLRMPPEVLARIDRAVEARRVKVPRHTWLMEAVIEKLEREEASSSA